MSDFFTVNLGVRQGSVLSPYLFAVYVNDVDCSRTGCHVILYADDILLIAPTNSTQLPVVDPPTARQRF